MTDETGFERGLRTMLARRDPGAPPAALTVEVRGRLATEAGRRRWGFGRVGGVVTPVLTAVAVLVVVGAISLRPAAVGPGASPAPAPSVLPATATDGSGIAPEILPPFLLALVAAGLVVGLLWVAWHSARRLIGYAAFAAALGIVWIWSMIGAPSALTIDGGIFGVVPYASPPSGSGDSWVAADGDSQFEILVTLTNASQLPVRILGIPKPSVPSFGTPPRILMARIVGLGSWPSMGECCLPEGVRPFEPLTLAAGQSLDVAFIGRAGACGTTPGGSGGWGGFSSVPIVYEQYTIVYRAEIALPHQVNIPQTVPCSPEGLPPAPSE
jgi:hypothetical protein